MGLREIAFSIVFIIVIGLDLLIATNDIRQSIKEAKELHKKNEEIIKKHKSDELKKEMCLKSIRGGVCPHDCDLCAWSTLK